MDALLVLLIIYLVYFVLSMILANGKYIEPSVIFTASFTAMLILAYIFRDYFGFRLQEATVTLLAVAGALFVFVSNMYRVLQRLIHKNQQRVITHKNIIYIKPEIQNGIILLMLFSIFLAILSLAIDTHGESWNERMQQYRNNLVAGETGQYRLWFFVSQLQKVITAAVYIISAIMMYNRITCGLSLKKQSKGIVMIGLYMISSALSVGGRQPAVEIILYTFIIGFLMTVSNRKKIKLFRIVLLAIPLLFVFILAFTLTAESVGRASTKRVPILYVSSYLCGGLYFLNSFVGRRTPPAYWGQNTFANIYKKLADFGIMPKSVVKTFHTFSKFGNTVTIFGRWYEDFGSTGVYIIICLVALFYSWLFYSIAMRPQRKKDHPLRFGQIMYARVLVDLVFAAYDDRVVSSISFPELMIVILMLFIYWLLIGKGSRISFKFK